MPSRRLLPLLCALVCAIAIPIPAGAAEPTSVPVANTAIEAGYDYTCALDAAGTASCWGRAPHGQGIPPATAFVDVSAGLYHSCGLTAAGAIECWGEPIIEALDPPPGTFGEVAVGSYHTCAIRTDQTLVCWVKVPDDQAILEPPAGAFHALSSGSDASCAIDTNDTIHCWGDPTLPDPPAGAFQMVAVGGRHACGLHVDGTVQCWGSRSDSPDTEFLSISAGGDGWCGLTTDKAIACFGHGEWATEPIEGPFERFSSDWHHACGFNASTGIQCWGNPSPPDPGTVPYLSSPEPPQGSVGALYAHHLWSSSMWPLPAFEFVSGSLPPGTALGGDGWITGSPTEAGAFTFVVRASNGIAPIVEGERTIAIAADIIPPTATAPTRKLVANSTMSGGKAPVRLTWSGSDATSGVGRFELDQSTDGAAWISVSTTLTKGSTDRLLAPGHTYRFRVRAVDKADNIGAWATGSTFTLSRYSEASSRITYSGTWRTASSSVYWGGAAKYASGAGAKATFTFTGKSIAWVARRGPTRGKAEILVNGTKVATVDLYRSAYADQQLVWTASWSTAAKRTITIRVKGTSGRPRVDLDGLLTTN